ncbi:MAG: hypothetical protein ABIP39_05590 [Polyangiaceae bacterium]
MIRSVGAAFVLGLGLLAPAAGCSATPDAPSGEAVGTSDSALTLTTADAVARADQWAAAKLQYCQAPNHARDYDSACSTYCNRTDNAAWDPYRSDCSGLVSWAWGLPAPGRVTGQFAPFQTDITHAIAASTLQAGDAVNNSDHIMIFKAWTVHDTQATFIEEPGCSSAITHAHELTSNVTISGNTIHVDYNGMTFTAIRNGALLPPNKPSIGALDMASCATISGWAQDPDAAKTSISARLYFDAPEGKTGGSGSITTAANVNRPDLCTKLGSCDHGFSVNAPMGVLDGAPHTVYAYGVDAAGNLSLLGPAKTMTCAPPAIPAPGVKRWITSSKILDAWKLSRLVDLAHEPKADVDAYPKGDDLPASPTVVVGDDGSPSVWVIDGAVRRHVVDPASLEVWQFAAVKWPVAQVNALPEGQAWPATPFLIQGTGDPAVYMVDALLPSAGGAPAAGPNADGTGPMASMADSNAGGGGGCATTRGTTTSGSAGLVFASFAMLGLLRRRR